MKISRRLCITLGLISAMQFPLAAIAQNRKATDHRPVLMISIDGLAPDYVIEADKYNLSIPILRKFLVNGSYAQAVVNVNPTVTYPNHTTLITGALPSEHGIYNNMVFDPLGKEKGIWNSFYRQIKVPTLWKAAKENGLITASISWPVTVHAKDIDYNIPEYGRTATEWDHYLMEAVSQPSGYLEKIEEITGPFFTGGDYGQDDIRIEAAALAMIGSERPDFLTIHITSLDHDQHVHGPLSPEANERLELVDAMVGRIIEKEKQVHPDAVVVIVSDHGFFEVTHSVHLNAALAQEGFITLSNDGHKSVANWDAFAWNGGTGLIILQKPDDEHIRMRLKAALNKLANDPVNGIERVYEQGEIKELGVAPNAAFLVAFKPGYTMGGKLHGPVVEKMTSRTGAHGAFTTQSIRPDMHSAFFIMGPGIAVGKNLGLVDMRQIAPTVSREMGVSMPSAKMGPLQVQAP